MSEDTLVTRLTALAGYLERIGCMGAVDVRDAADRLAALEAERDEALACAVAAADDCKDYMDLTQRLKRAEARVALEAALRAGRRGND